jgi:uncharacterized protein DUF4350
LPTGPSASGIGPPGLALAAAGYAAAELLLTLTLGRFFDWGRAEALLFLAYRPWLLIAAAALAARHRWQRRLAFYALALALAGLCESLLLVGLGAADPWPEVQRGIAAGAALLIPADLLARAGWKRAGGVGAGAAAVAAAALLLVPAARAPYDSLAIGRAESASAAGRPALLLMTSLPIVWGERGAFDLRSGPSETYKALLKEYELRPIDALDERSLGAGGLLLLAQPRGLAPAELAALDGWLRGGGRALILVDPALAWPSELPLGDIRRPAPLNMLGPLLAHWGLELQPPRSARLEVARLGRRKLVMDAPGGFASGGGACRVESAPYLANCRIGEGRVVLLADADLLRDDLWAAPGPGGGARHRRVADNPLVVADLLDRLAGRTRQRAAGEADWPALEAKKGRALLLALLPIGLFALGGVFMLGWRRVRPQTCPQARKWE